MKKRLLTMLLVVLMTISCAIALAACKPDHSTHPDENQDGICDIGGEKLTDPNDPNDKEDPDDNKPTTYTAPVITVTPAEMELTKGTSEDQFSLLYGVTVKDDYDKDLKATVKNDGGFDIDKIGDYTVTYSATNSKGKEGTATRVYHIVAPLPNLTLKVQKENDTANWVDKFGHVAGLMTFKNEEYIELTADTTYDQSTKGVFHNKSTSSIIVSVAGGHGEAAILNAQGVVIEARDGANGRLVDVDHPVRTSSTVTTLPEEWFEEPAEGDSPNYTVASNYAFHMEIPAGGFAIVIPNGGSFDEDGRGWLNKNVVYQYGAAVQLYFEDEPDELLCTYADQAPVVLAAENVIIRQNDGTDATAAEALLLEGVSYVDDHGTWDIADDVKEGLEISIVTRPTPGYSNTELGTYTYKLRITDGTNEREFNRSIVVREPMATMPTVSIDGVWYEFAENKIVVNPKNVADPKTYDAIIYNSYFTGEYVRNDFSPYFIVDKDGKIVLTYHPKDAKYYEMGDDGAIQETPKGNTNVLNDVKIPEGGYVVLAVYDNWFNQKMRAEIEKPDKMLGKTVEMFLFSVFPTVTVTKADGSKVSYSGNKIIVNADGKTAAQQSFLVYTKAYQAEKLNTNGWGIAIVLGADSKIVKVYDGANSKYWDKDNDGVAAGTFFGAGTFAEDAFKALGEDEILVVFPNNGSNQEGSPRKFANDHLRTIGLTVTFSNFNISGGGTSQPTDKKQVKIGSAVLDVSEVAVNDAAAKAVEGGILIYTKSYEGTLLNSGYGVAIVVGADNKVVASYDGANGKLFNADNPSGGTGCTGAGYISEAFAATPAGGYIIVFPHVGGANTVRGWALSNARGSAIGATVELVNISLPSQPTDEKQVKIGSAVLDVSEVAVNVDKAVTASYDVLIFTHEFKGTYTNGYGYASVVKDGKIVRVYDGANGKYRDAENPDGIVDNSKCTAGGYAAEAIASLQEGEFVIIFPNGGKGGNDLRTWGGTNARAIGATVELVNISLT